MLAMNLDKAVYCEKPLTHDIAEARKLREMARQSKAPTQMGNQGHCQDGYRRLCEFIWAGAIGNVTQTYSWTDRANGGTGPRPPYKPVPAGMHWDSWIGPAPYRDYHDDLHPHEWHGWYDFGNGSLGNMGCHVLDGVYWALKLRASHQRRGRGDPRRQRRTLPYRQPYPLGLPGARRIPPVKVYGTRASRKMRRRAPPEI